jgi:uncharacterized RDD family membrane protein YckC
MSENQILDSPLVAGDRAYNALDHLASNGKRFLNLLIDTVVYYVLAIVVGVILGLTGNVDVATGPITSNIIGLAIMIVYYVIMEATIGATVGKLVTQTQVVTESGERPSLGQIVGRSFARLIPFEAFSFLGGNPGWHDTLASTFVVKKNA